MWYYIYIYHIFIHRKLNHSLHRNLAWTDKGKDYMQTCKQDYSYLQSQIIAIRDQLFQKAFIWWSHAEEWLQLAQYHESSKSKNPIKPMSFPNLPNIDQHRVQLMLSHTSRRSELRVLTIQKDWWLFLFKNTCYKQHLTWSNQTSSNPKICWLRFFGVTYDSCMEKKLRKLIYT